MSAELEAGAKILQPYFLGLLADVYKKLGNAEKGLSLIDEALEVMATTEVRFYEVELYRLQGELLLQRTPPEASAAEACLNQAIAVARQHQAKSLELRAATSLSRLWQSQGKNTMANNLLEPIYEWFTEGLDTVDLREAKQLLQTLNTRS